MQSLTRRWTLGLALPFVLAGSAAGLNQLGAFPGFAAVSVQPAPIGTPVSNPLSTLGVPAVAKAAVATAIAAAPDLHAQIHWVEVHKGKDAVMTPDAASRLLLVQAAAERANLAEVGLNYQDVYGLINAETSWLPRTGVGKTGTHSYGLAQFEPGTAKGLGLKDPNDPVEAVYAAALHMKTAAQWSADKLSALKLPPQVYAEKLREGVSIYYNLSWKGRRAWNGMNTDKLPEATLRHIENTRWGAQRAEFLAQKLGMDSNVG